MSQTIHSTAGGTTSSSVLPRRQPTTSTHIYQTPNINVNNAGKFRSRKSTSRIYKGNRITAYIRRSIMDRPCFERGRLVLRLLIVLFSVGAGMAQFAHLVAGSSGAWVALLRCYGVLFCLVVAVNELETAALSHTFSFLDSWIFRGLFLILSGALMVGVQPAKHIGIFWEEAGDISGSALVASGVIYFFLGVLCCSHLRRRRVEKLRTREKLTHEVGELAHIKSEIESLMAETASKLDKL